MTFSFIYEPDYVRIMTAVIIDSRASIPLIKNQIGDIIKEYIDNQVAVVNDTSIVYKIETELGVLAGFFSLQVVPHNKTANLVLKQFRPAFVQFDSDLSLQIGNFIQSMTWQQDYLF